MEENLFVSNLSVEEKVRIAMSVGEETLTVEELTALFTSRQHPIVYDGFEPSGMYLRMCEIDYKTLRMISTAMLDAFLWC